MAQEPLSLRAYAQHRKRLGLPGGSLQAVQRAIEAERISYLLVGGQKRIPDPEAADREWAANTDSTRRQPGGLGDEDEALEDGEEAGQLRAAVIKEKQAKANIAELNYRRRAGELLEASDVEATWADHCAMVRTKALGLPNRMKQRHPELTLEQLATLDEELRSLLTELADDDDDEDES